MDPALHGALFQLGLQGSFSRLGFPRLAGNLSLWDFDEALESPSVRNAHGHGVLLDRMVFEKWLLNEVRASGVRVILSSDRMVLERRSCWQLSTAETTLQAGYVIEATGRAAGQVAPPERRFSDHQVCLLAYPRAPANYQDCRLLIEAGENGWWYSALLPGGRLVIALCVARETLSRMRGRSSDDWFWRELERTRLIPHVPRVRSVGHPASSSLRCQMNGPGWVAIGDAAATYDPLFGRGVPMALTKGIAAARLLVQGTDHETQAAIYARAERETYESYLDQQRATYRRIRQHLTAPAPS